MRISITIAALTVALLAGGARSAEETPVAVIVNPERHVALSREELARIFLRQRRFWEDGASIHPINRESGSAARESFSRRVLGAGSEWFASYWNDRFFEGTFPPTTLSSDAAVKRYVATDRDAIGYIARSEVDQSVTAVLDLP